MVCRNEEITILREFQSRKESLKYLQKLPLEYKINLSKNLILNCIETFGDQQVYISFSGGKDSTVLSSLVCSLKPNILHLFSDTGCEYPETLSFVGAERHRGKNIVSVHPICRDGSIWTFERIVATYGYPLFCRNITPSMRRPPGVPKTPTAFPTMFPAPPPPLTVKWWIGPMPSGNSRKGVSIPCTTKRLTGS